MTTFFWIAQAANGITTIVTLSALLVVLWLGPRQWTNLSFAALMLSISTWMGSSFLARLLLNVPQLGGDAAVVMNAVSLGFACIGISLFWFVESFYPIDRRIRLAANLLGVAVYGTFLVLLSENAIVTDVQRGSEGGIDFKITPLATALSAFQYLYEGIALWLLIRHTAWRSHWRLMIGAVITIATTIAAIVVPGIAIQTYMIVFGALFMAYEVVNQQLFNPLVQLNSHLEAEVQRRSTELADSLAAQERVRSELAAARTIQLSLLPHHTPTLPHIRVAGCSLPAKEVGGDFFSYHSYADGRLGVAVGDVSGKGIPAALLMALALNTFETLADAYHDQGALLRACNSSLTPRMQQSRQNAAFLSVVLDSQTYEAQVANAGLIAPLLWRDGTVRYIDSYGVPLGAISTANYTQQRVILQPNDTLLLCSDGLVEAMNNEGGWWGFEALEATFAAVAHQPPDAVLNALLDAVRTFTGNAPQHDDMTLVVLQMQPN